MKKQWRAFYAEVDSYTINSKPSLKLLHNLPNNASAPLQFTPYSDLQVSLLSIAAGVTCCSR